MARGRIANRLYALPDQRQAFRERLAELTDSVWDEARLGRRAHADRAARGGRRRFASVIDTTGGLLPGGFVSDGAVELDAADMAPGAPVTGRLSGRLLQFGGFTQ